MRVARRKIRQRLGWRLETLGLTTIEEEIQFLRQKWAEKHPCLMKIIKLCKHKPIIIMIVFVHYLPKPRILQ